MTDSQLSAVLAAIASLGGSLILALRWAVNRVTKSNDDGTAALIGNTASNAVLVVEIRHLAEKIDQVSDFVEEHTPIGPIPRRTQTPQRGLRIARPGTHHDRNED